MSEDSNFSSFAIILNVRNVPEKLGRLLRYVWLAGG
jgi:hypothetical protein